MFQRGALWSELTRTTERALANGALLPLPTEYELVEDSGIQFLVRVVTNLARKQQLDTRSDSQPDGAAPNPFLPYEQALFVADVSETHVCLLNKYNVVDHHLLIVTREFESQENPLNLLDFSALWTCLAEYEGLGFYNAGQVAGASQPHKHLQLIPLPLVPNGPAVPIEPLIENIEFRGDVGRWPSLPFPHAAARLGPRLWESPALAARRTASLYGALMESIGLTANTSSTGAYNLLLTRRWILLVPRYVETYVSVSLNALAFAGALLVRDQQQLSQLKSQGLMAALKYAATPTDATSVDG